MLIRRYALSGLAALLSLFSTLPTVAQIQPDETLGSEGSLITEDVAIRGDLADLIEGGATRGGNLFHSFLEFNVDEGQRVYFANPVGIESILSRVTGENPSNVLGLLGVDGSADLFLINPNGILFGEAATFDIEGSFYGTTGDAVELGNEVFSAVEPESSRLLQVSPSILLENYLSEDSGDIENRGQLAVLGDLVLSGNGLDLQGQVAAGGDLTLLGLDEVRIRDTGETPFVGFAGGDLLVQGNQQVDIVALSHPDSGLFSYGNLVLRSESPVGGDAHYWSGGGFRVETLEGDAGALKSPVDPIIRTLGDVEIDVYEGSSLHILAGGSVDVGTAVINEPDPGELGIDFLSETITLSDGMIVAIDGGARPTLDIRAGVDPDALGTPPLELITGFDAETDAFFGDSRVPENPSGSDISVGDIFIDASNGLVLLTNQYVPNTEIEEGNIFVRNQGALGNGIDVQGFDAQGGAVYLDSRNNVEVEDSYIFTTGTGDIGNIVINASNTVLFESTGIGELTGAFADVDTNVEGSGGNIRINANDLEVLNGAQLSTSISGMGSAGNVMLNIVDSARFTGFDTISGFSSSASSNVNSGAEGVGGNVQISARNLEVSNEAFISTSSDGIGDVGDVILNISETARFETSDRTISGVSGDTFGTGNGGNVTVNANRLEILNGAQIRASTFGLGDAGNISLNISETARFEGSNSVGVSGVFSNVEIGSEGGGGEIQLSARNLEVVDGAQVGTLIFGTGDAGNVALDISETARFTGIDPVESSPSGVFSSIQGGVGRSGDLAIRAVNLELVDGAQLGTFNSGVGVAGDILLDIEETVLLVGASVIDSSVSSEGNGDGGNIEIQATNLELMNNALLNASTSGAGNAGSVILNISQTAHFSDSGVSSAVVSDQGYTGGNVEINTRNLEVLDGAFLDASIFGLGQAGNVIIDVTETARFLGFDQADGNPSSAASTIQAGGEGRGGNVEVRASNLEVLDGAVLITSTFGPGDAGSVILDIAETASFIGSDPASGSFSGAFSSVESGGNGRGGRIQISAENLDILDAAVLSTSSFGVGDAGNIIIDIAETVRLEGYDPVLDGPGGIFSSIELDGDGDGGDVQIDARNIEVLSGAQLSTETRGTGDAGNVVLNISESARFIGFDPTTGSNTGITASTFGIGDSGSIQINTRTLEVIEGAQLATSTFSTGGAGSIVLNVSEQIRLAGANPVSGSFSGVISNTQPEGKGGIGRLQINAANLEIVDEAILATSNLGSGDSGEINLVIAEEILLDNGLITSRSEVASGGQINIESEYVILRNDSDIITFVSDGEDGGGNIKVKSDFVIALDDSDILAFSIDGFGGEIDLSQTTLFSQNLNPAVEGLNRDELFALDGNGQVDINATGGISSGDILINDASFIENSLNELADEFVDTATLTAGSCIVSNDGDNAGSFIVSGGEGLPQQPGIDSLSVYPTDDIQSPIALSATSDIQEAHGIYQLANGRLVLSHECGG